MKAIILFVFFSLILFQVKGQVTEGEKQLRKQDSDTTKGWKRGGVTNLGLTQTSLTNWAAGGENSVAINSLFSSWVAYKKKSVSWENNLDLGYGLLKQGDVKKWRKTDDKIDFLSKYGQKATKSFYYAALLNFKTQFSPGYKLPNDSVKISDFLAPAYLICAIGMDYIPNEKFNAFLAPLTGKLTLVNNQKLADAGAFGVEKGKKSRKEFGGYLRVFYKKNDIVKNVNFQSKVDFFSNYLNNPQNVDVSWENLIGLKVNKFITVTITTHLIYDDDISIPYDKNKDGIIDGSGPRTQFKEVISFGFSYNFK